MNAHPSIRRLPRAARALLAAALFGAACNPETEPGGDVTVRGRVTDGDGSQFTRVGGSGSIDQAAVVTAYRVGDDGSLEAIGSATVEADGSFEMTAPSGEQGVVVQALSAEGDVVASAILEATGEAGDTVACTPLDTESSVEAEILLAAIAQQGDAEAVNLVDLRVRVDADTAVAVRASFEDGGEAEGEAAIDALAEAVLAAQATEIAAWSEMGFETTQQAMLALEIEASQALSEALYDGEDSGSAWADFTASLEAAVDAASGLSEAEQAEAESQAGMAFRLVVDARLDAGPIAWEATQAAAQAEASAYAEATAALFAAADASSAVQDEVESAGAGLIADAEAAASTAALVEAWADFQAALIGETTVEGSALGTHLGLSGATALLADGTFDTCVASAEGLETGLWAEVSLLLSGALDANALATTVIEAWAEHRATVEAAMADADPVIPAAEASFAADVTVLATAGYRGVE